MLTPQDVLPLSNEARGELFIRLATKFYGTINFGPLIARDFDISRQTQDRWRNDGTVPVAVIYTLDAWCSDGHLAQQEFNEWSAVPEQLASAATLLSRTASVLSRISRRRFSALDGQQDDASAKEPVSASQQSPAVQAAKDGFGEE